SLVAASEDGLVRVWDIAEPPPSRALPKQSGSLFGLGWSADGRWLATPDDAHNVLIRDSVTGKTVRTLRMPSPWVRAATWSPDGRRLALTTLSRSGIDPEASIR